MIHSVVGQEYHLACGPALPKHILYIADFWILFLLKFDDIHFTHYYPLLADLCTSRLAKKFLTERFLFSCT